MGIINVLPKDVSNKIAAGEVVERPASVIKELVENAIDADADKITVEIKKGGTIYMRVSDNGKGMSAEDAALCFLRHATSKIQKSEDLDAIYTLGFRGEALSSIGAVAKVTLYTKRRDEEGVCVSCEGGEILSSEEAGLPNGTTMIVENLFYNTPARAKFLKKDATEAGYITDIMTKFIFAHPEISFKLIVNGKEQLFSAGDNKIENAIYTVYGKDYARASLPVLYEDNGIKVTGIVGKGNIARPNRSYQSFFVNKRYIKSPMIIRAVEEAYKNQIMIGKFPMAVLNIELSPGSIDINVHPTKMEVKFSDEREVYRAVYYAVKNALYALPNVPEIEKKEKAEDFLGIPLDIMKAPKKEEHNPRVNPFLSKNDEASTPKKVVYKESFISPSMQDKIANIEKITPTLKVSEPIEEIEAKKAQASDFSPAEEEIKTYIEKPPQQPIEDAQINIEQSREEENVVLFDEYFEVIGQLFDSYIIIQKDDNMLMIDQHAAHERLKYEQLLKDMENNDIISQILLEPVVVKLSGEEMGVYEDNATVLNSLGFESEVFGNDTVLLRSIPGDVSWGEAEELFVELLTQSKNLKNELISEKNQRLIYTIACKSAIKANHRMQMPEMEALCKSVFALKNINTCPHGRPIVISMSKKEIEKEFKRIT